MQSSRLDKYISSLLTSGLEGIIQKLLVENILHFQGALFMQKKNRILFITHYGELYGANRSLLDLVSPLKKNYNLT